MSNKPVLVLIVLVALGALFFAFGGSDLLSGGGGDQTDPDTEASIDPLTGEARPEAGGLHAAADADGGPTLFARRKEDLVGAGTLRGMVKNFKTGALVQGATVVIVGTGYGDEKVSTQALTGTAGTFELGPVAAGSRYQLHISAPSKLQRTYPAISVDAGADKDLGTIWLGQSGVLEGIVVDEAGHKIAQADVSVFAGGGSMLELARNWMKLFEELHKDPVPLQRTQTDASGRFQLEDVDPGPLTVVVRARGFHQKLQNEVMTSEGAAGGALRIQVKGCDPLVGTVVDGRGRGIPAARVAFLNKDDMSSVLFGRHAALADEEGRFTVDAPPTGGKYAIIATAVGYPNLLTEVSAADAEIRLEMKEGAELTVRLLEKDTNRPVEGARLMGMFSAGERFSGDDMDFASVVTDERGEAVLLTRPGSLQMLWMNHPEKGSGAYAPRMGGMGAQGILSGPEKVEVKAPRTTLIFHVQAGVTIRGRVADTEGNPVPGARVMATGAMGMGGGGGVSGEDGRYELTGQSAPIMAVLATAPGYVQKLEGFNGMSMVSGEPGEDLEHDVVMQRAATVSGRVVDPKGTPLSGVRVRVQQSGPMAMLTMFTGSSSEGITNREGRYVLSGAQPGAKSTVIARLAGWLDSGTEPFEIKAGAANEALDLVMKLGALMEVTVHDPEGAALAGARVQVDVDSSKDVNWDPMGSFRGFDDQVTREGGKVEIKDLPDGKITVTASKEGFAASRLVTEVKEGKATSGNLVVALREAFTLRGRVVDADGKPAKGVDVEVNPVEYALADKPAGEWAPSGRATTDAQGQFEVEGLPDVPTKIELSGDGYQELTRSLAGPRGLAELTVQRMNAGTAARMEAVQKELMKVYQQFSAAKTQEDKAVVLKKVQALQAEMEALKKGQSPDEAKAAGADAAASAPSGQEER